MTLRHAGTALIISGWAVALSAACLVAWARNIGQAGGFIEETFALSLVGAIAATAAGISMRRDSRQ